MALDREKTKALLDVVMSGFNFFAAQRSNLELLTPTATGKVLDSDIVAKMAVCLQIKELASVMPIDDEFVKAMESDDFRMVQGLLTDRIRKLAKQMKSNTEIDADLGGMVNSFFDERIAFLSDIKIDLQEMLDKEMA